MNVAAANIDSAAYQAEYIGLVQPLVDSPVIAVALMSRRGALTDTVVGKLGPSAYWALRARGKRKAPGLPRSVMLAVTDGHLHVFSHAFKKGKTVVTGEVARWERNGMQVDADQTRSCDVLLLTLGDGTRYEFESMRCYDFNYALFSELLQPVG